MLLQFYSNRSEINGDYFQVLVLIHIWCWSVYLWHNQGREQYTVFQNCANVTHNKGACQPVCICWYNNDNNNKKRNTEFHQACITESVFTWHSPWGRWLGRYTSRLNWRGRRSGGTVCGSTCRWDWCRPAAGSGEKLSPAGGKSTAAGLLLDHCDTRSGFSSSGHLEDCCPAGWQGVVGGVRR